MGDFNYKAMKKTISIIVMAGAMIFWAGAQEIGNEELAQIRESFPRTQDNIARMNAISAMATCTMQEAQIENLLIAKDFDECVVYIGNDTVTVAVPAPAEGLSQEAVARITDVICSETQYTAAQLSIIEVKA